LPSRSIVQTRAVPTARGTAPICGVSIKIRGRLFSLYASSSMPPSTSIAHRRPGCVIDYRCASNRHTGRGSDPHPDRPRARALWWLALTINKKAEVRPVSRVSVSAKSSRVAAQSGAPSRPAGRRAPAPARASSPGTLSWPRPPPDPFATPPLGTTSTTPRSPGRRRDGPTRGAVRELTVDPQPSHRSSPPHERAFYPTAEGRARSSGRMGGEIRMRRTPHTEKHFTPATPCGTCRIGNVDGLTVPFAPGGRTLGAPSTPRRSSSPQNWRDRRRLQSHGSGGYLRRPQRREALRPRAARRAGSRSGEKLGLETKAEITRCSGSTA